MKAAHWIIGFVLCLFCFGFGTAIGWFGSNSDGSATLGRTLVLEWGDRIDDGKVSIKGMYGAHAFVTHEGDDLVVRARILIGRPDWMMSYYHDCGEIGRAKNFEEAQQKWGRVTWSEKSVCFGEPNAGGFCESRAQFQKHR